jgi:hypothetical protein
LRSRFSDSSWYFLDRLPLDFRHFIREFGQRLPPHFLLDIALTHFGHSLAFFRPYTIRF